MRPSTEYAIIFNALVLLVKAEIRNKALEETSMRAEHTICYTSVFCTNLMQYLQVPQAKLNTQRLAVHEAVKPELCHLRYCLSTWGPRVSLVLSLCRKGDKQPRSVGTIDLLLLCCCIRNQLQQ